MSKYDALDWAISALRNKVDGCIQKSDFSEFFMAYLMNLTPKKEATWLVFDPLEDAGFQWLQCSNCGQHDNTFSYFKFCPNCGAEMNVKED